MVCSQVVFAEALWAVLGRFDTNLEQWLSRAVVGQVREPGLAAQELSAAQVPAQCWIRPVQVPVAVVTTNRVSYQQN